MKTITIELTDQQEYFLKMFAANHYPGAADNLATRKPIHVVQTEDTDWPFDDHPYARRYRNVAYFFILAEAMHYMQYQSHNLHNPRTFTYSSGYANHGDFEHFWDLLLSIGKMLNEEGGGKADEAS